MGKWICLMVVALMLPISLGCYRSVQTGPLNANRAGDNLVVAGSGSNLPITGKLIEQFVGKTGEKIEMPSSIGSAGAVKAVKEGAIKLGLTSRPLKDDELKEGLRQLPYARIGVVLGVNPSVPETEITSQELVQIYRGDKTTWGNGKKIVVLSREDGDSSNQVLGMQIKDFAATLQDSLQNKRWQVLLSDAEEARAIENTPNALGLTDTAALRTSRLSIKPLSLNGIAPTVENIAGGKYTLTKDLYFIYKEPLDDRAKEFLDFVYSGEGKTVISSSGAIPLKGDR